MELETLEINISSKSTDATKNIDTFVKSLRRLKNALNFTDNGNTSGIDSLVGKIEKLQGAIEKLNPKNLENLATIASKLTNGKMDFGKKFEAEAKRASAAAGMVLKAQKALNDTTPMQSPAIKEPKIGKGGMSSFFEAIKKGSTDAWASFTKKADGAFSSITRIAKYRLIRTALKEISEGFNLGLKNAYEFSKTVNYSLATSLDKLASASLKMKNQLGASFGALIEAIMPLVLKLINLVTKLADVITQIISAFGGKVTYLKATDVTTSWGEATKAAKKYERTVLGFDELNKLNAPTSSGSSSTPGASAMFEVKDIDPRILKNLNKIKILAAGIATALAAWKLTKFLKDIGLSNTQLKKAFGVLGGIVGTIVTIDGLVDSIKKGLNWKNLLKMLAGAAAATLSLGLAFGTVGTAVGLLVGGVALLVAGFVDWVKTGELSTEAFVALEAGILAVGAAISLLIANPIPLLISAIAMVALYTYQYWDEIKLCLEKAWTWIKNAASNAWTWIKNAANKVKEFFSTVFNNVVDWIGGGLRKAYEAVANKINSIIDSIEKVLGKKDWLEAMRLPTSADWARYGAASGKALGDALAKNIRLSASFNAGSGNLSMKMTNTAMTFADGGFPSQGSTFIAGEVPGEYEFVGDINGKTGVVSGAEISGIGDAIRTGTAILADLLSKNNEYARETAAKDYNPTVSVSAINDAQYRNNRRLGKTVNALAY